MSHHDPMLPRTDGERHLSEGTMSSNNMGRNESEDTETLRIMQEAGFDPAMPIDPSSLKAIQELLTPKQAQRKSPTTMEDSKPSAIPNLVTEDTKENASLDPSSVGASLEHVPSEVLRPISLGGRVTSDLTMGALRSETPFEEDQTDASTAGSTQRTGGNMEKRILDQMQMQTALLIDLQRRVDELTHIVISQQGQLQQQHQQQQGAFVTRRQATIVNQAVPQQQARNILPPMMQPQARNAPAAAQLKNQHSFLLCHNKCFSLHFSLRFLLIFVRQESLKFVDSFGISRNETCVIGSISI